MEEISGTKSHKLILNNRRTGSFTGILDVLSFDVGEILLETELDMITYSKVPEVTGKKDKMFGRIFR